MDKQGSVTIERVKLGNQTYEINKTYDYLAEYRIDDGNYWLIQFPALPEAITQALQEEEIEVMAADALEVCCAAYLNLCRDLPAGVSLHLS